MGRSRLALAAGCPIDRPGTRAAMRAATEPVGTVLTASQVRWRPGGPGWPWPRPALGLAGAAASASVAAPAGDGPPGFWWGTDSCRFP